MKEAGGSSGLRSITGFSQINPPVNSIEVDAIQQINAFYENPTIRLDFERFSSDSMIEFQNLQTTILRRYSKYTVTTNATGLATNSIDYYKSTKELDCYGFDYYPGLRDAAVDSFPYAFARGIKGGKPFWVMEFVSGGGHRLRGSGRLQPNPGAMKQAAVQAFAHGADMMLHFQYRSFPMGAEQLNYAIVDLDGLPRRRYYEMKDTAKTLKELEPLAAAEFDNEVAVLVDYDTHWALRIKPVNDPVFQYLDYCGKLFHGFREEGMNADVISFQEDFSRYKIVILPAGFILPVSMREKLKSFVQKGGILISTFLFSVKNEDNIGYTETLPAGLNELFGISVEEVEPVFQNNHTRLRLQQGDQKAECADGLWSELLVGDADMIGVYEEDYKKGFGVISEHTYGEGKAYYIGTDLDANVLKILFSNIASKAGIKRNSVRGTEKVEILRRKLDGKSVYFVFNFNTEEQQLVLPEKTMDYITGREVGGKQMIERNGFMVLMREE